MPGDLICFGRGSARDDALRRSARGAFPRRIATSWWTTAAPDQIGVIGGNVDDAVTLKHVPVTPDGRLAGLDRPVLDTRYPWMVVLRLIDAGPSPVVATAR